MTANEKPRLYALPRDKSLQAYKDWILGFYAFLTGKPEAEAGMTEEEWIKEHKKFWEGDSDPAEKEGGANA